ncbi:MAG: response regulator [Hydrogenoanaerobacterium sp.]
MNFVVVDNDKRDLDLLMNTLAAIMPECQIQPFADPLLSAKYICNNEVDAAFVAAEMRPVDGLVLLRVLRTNKPDLPIVIMSSKEMNRVDAIYAGATEHLLKPVSAEPLSSLVKQFLFY